MNIVMDTRWIGPHGIGRFASELRARIPCESHDMGGSPAAPLDPVRLMLLCARLSAPTTFFSPGFNGPVWSRCPAVFSIHDLNHIDRPENSSLAKRLYYAQFMRRAAENAAAVLTVSDFSKRRIEQWSGIDPAKVFNVGNGISPLYTPAGNVHAPGYPYLFCVSNRKLHKNEFAVVSAFAKSALSSSWRLVFSGTSSPDLMAHVAACGQAERVVFLGLVEEAYLPAVYRGAVALIFPSLYEGFGLPVVEAFACGTPVITSTTTSLPEVAGDAAILVDPTSIDAIAAAIDQLSGDESMRRDLSARGIQRSKRFSWDSVGDRVKSVLEAVAAGVRPADRGWPDFSTVRREADL